MQEWYLGQEKASSLERHPQFRSVLIEGFQLAIVQYIVQCLTDLFQKEVGYLSSVRLASSRELYLKVLALQGS